MQQMSPIDWALRPLKRYAQFSGRAPRAEYWWFWLAYVLLSIVLNILTRMSSIFGLLGILYLGLLIPMIAVGVRRLHDTNRTGWWLVAPAVPYILGVAMIFPALIQAGTAGTPPSFGSFGPAMILIAVGGILAFVIFIFSVMPGDKGPNRYGPDPYDEDNLEEVFA
jgi:uncharacterized membrane protein YhaH (DUF805 family)